MSWQPERGLSGFAVVALHALALAALLGATAHREAIVAALPLQVSIVAEAKPLAPEPAPPRPAPRLEAAVVDLPPMPAVAIEAAPPSEVIAASRAPSVSVAPRPAVAAEAAPRLVPPAFDADYLANPAPPYPALSRRLNEQGRVLVRVLVTPDGHAERVEVARSSGHERLDRSALEAVARWRFVPARRGETAVAAHVLVPVDFVLKA